MQEHYIDTPEKLAQLVTQLRGSEWVAVDTEFIREKTYYPRLCLIQISNGEQAACVDPLQIDDLSPLLELLYDGTLLKVFHAGAQDIEIFWHNWGRFPIPLFDTQPAAALLGLGDQIGYANLVSQMLGIGLEKSQSRTDWGRRPLTLAQIRYALDDVIYLGALYLKIRGQLSAQARLLWLAAEYAELASPQHYAPDPWLAWRKIKGTQRLKAHQLGVLRELAAWRELRARESDRPRKWVLPDQVLLDIAMARPQHIAELALIRDLPAALLRRQGEEILGLVHKASVEPELWPQPQGRIQLNTQQHAKLDLMQAGLRLIADQHQLSPNAIASRHQLELLLLGDTHCQLMQGWRRVLAGETLQALAAGKLQITEDAGRLSLSPAPP